MSERRINTDRDGWADRLAANVLDRSDAAARRVRVVAVEGRSGSGKSTVAERLRAALAARGEAAAVLTMEDLYPGWDGLAEAPELLRAWVLDPLAHGRRAAWRRYDWERAEFSPSWTSPSPAVDAEGGVLVVEGCGSGAATVRPYLDALVWVAASDEARARRLDGRWDAAVYAPYRELWAGQEDAFHARHRTREYADLVVDNAGGASSPG